MDHAALSLSAPPDRTFGLRPDDDDDAARVGLPDHLALQAFRSAVTRRGGGGLTPFLLPNPRPLTCWPCFHDAAERLGLTLERVRPSPGEAGVLERYDLMSFRFHRDPEDASRQADFYAARHYGLVRLSRDDTPDEDIWVWLYRDVRGADAACLAAPSREAFQPFLRAIHDLDVEHDRRYAGLILVGNYGETKADRAPVAWEDVILPDGMRDDLRETVEEFFAARDLYRRHGIPHRRGILLSGPPGNGKTSILKAVGASQEVPVVVAALDDPARRRHLHDAFQRAADLAPAIACFEDLDALVDDGPGLSQFLNLLDGLEPLDGVLVLATTNRPDRIDPAIAKRPSRFDRVFVIPEPEAPQREAYVARQLGADAPDGAPARLAAETAGYSVAFLKELVLQARLAAVRRGADALVDADLDAALATTREHIRLASRGLEHRGAVGF